MRVVTVKRLAEACRTHPKASATINHWITVTQAASWTNLAETRATFRHADQVAVKSKRTVTIFNITNDYRLITAIHYNTGIVFILRFLTHAEYSKNHWKSTL